MNCGCGFCWRILFNCLWMNENGLNQCPCIIFFFFGFYGISWLSIQHKLVLKLFVNGTCCSTSSGKWSLFGVFINILDFFFYYKIMFSTMSILSVCLAFYYLPLWHLNLIHYLFRLHLKVSTSLETEPWKWRLRHQG